MSRLRIAEHGSRNARRRDRSPRGVAFTLVELLVAIAIIAILASLLLGVAARAGETAREARTKQLIARLHTLVMEHYESYRTQRVETRDNPAANLAPTITGIDPSRYAADAGLVLAATRLAAIRELMKMEMPDRWSDVLLEAVQDPPVAPTTDPLFVDARTGLNRLYLRRYREAVDRGFSKEDIEANQGAECLYLIVMNATADGEARGLFNEDDIGDTDQDGLLEFIDGWGAPIEFLRWAPGFDSDLQVSYGSLLRVLNRSSTAGAPVDNVAQELLDDHDPFDLFRVDQTTVTGPAITNALRNAQGTPLRGWRLVPLIYSAGGDEESGLQTGEDFVAAVDPWPGDVAGDADNQHLGEAVDTDATADNITNHLITTR